MTPLFPQQLLAVETIGVMAVMPQVLQPVDATIGIMLQRFITMPHEFIGVVLQAVIVLQVLQVETGMTVLQVPQLVLQVPQLLTGITLQRFMTIELQHPVCMVLQQRFIVIMLRIGVRLQPTQLLTGIALHIITR